MPPEYPYRILDVQVTPSHPGDGLAMVSATIEVVELEPREVRAEILIDTASSTVQWFSFDPIPRLLDSDDCREIIDLMRTVWIDETAHIRIGG